MPRPFYARDLLSSAMQAVWLDRYPQASCRAKRAAAQALSVLSPHAQDARAAITRGRPTKAQVEEANACIAVRAPEADETLAALARADYARFLGAVRALTREWCEDRSGFAVIATECDGARLGSDGTFGSRFVDLLEGAARCVLEGLWFGAEQSEHVGFDVTSYPAYWEPDASGIDSRFVLDVLCRASGNTPPCVTGGGRRLLASSEPVRAPGLPPRHMTDAIVEVVARGARGAIDGASGTTTLDELLDAVSTASGVDLRAFGEPPAAIEVGVSSAVTTSCTPRWFGELRDRRLRFELPEAVDGFA